MPPLFHPWLREARLAALRGGGWRRWRGGLALLAAIAWGKQKQKR